MGAYCTARRHTREYCSSDLDGCENLEPKMSYSFFDVTYATKLNSFVKQTRKKAKRLLNIEGLVFIPLWTGVLDFDQ
jgi:hypothetical protein